MENLLSRGFDVTAGILSTLDTDYELATHFDIPVVSDPPFSPASEQAYETTLKFIERADVVVLTEIPIGWGNMKNLEAAERALKMGKLLIMIGTTPFEERDFTGGEARKRLAALIQEGAICVKNSEEALAEIIKLKDNG
jgi:iron complex transport system ATP-binding protein